MKPYRTHNYNYPSHVDHQVREISNEEEEYWKNKALDIISMWLLP